CPSRSGSRHDHKTIPETIPRTVQETIPETVQRIIAETLRQTHPQLPTNLQTFKPPAQRE
ncbi:hypothetical protein ACRPLG_19130, partial [Bacillus safensis]|uniref:hypothetical protein n=1 Tax=Bacillus safensis TaxID=561879 RepID=UPI003D7861C9